MSIAVNYDDVLHQLREAGLIVEALDTGTSRPRRVRIEGSREKKGWYWLHEIRLDDGRFAIVGSYGVWHGNENNAQKVKLRDIAISHEQAKALKARLAEDRRRAEAARKRELERAARRAAAAWAKCAEIPDRTACEYLVKRNIDAHGARMTPAGTLVVPMQDTSGQIHGLQFLGPAVRKKLKDTDKQYWPAGMSQTGRFFMFGRPGPVILICEGFVTGAALHEETGHCTVAAFDANNLLPVGQAIHKRHPLARLLFCADDDFATRGNPGIAAAQNAVLGVGGAWLAPIFPPDPDNTFREDLAAAGLDIEAPDYKQQVEAIRRGRKKRTDFDDLRQYGPHLVLAQVDAKLEELGWRGVGQVGALPRPAVAGDALRPIQSVQELFDRFAIVYGHSKSLFDYQERILLPSADVQLACAGRETWKVWSESADKRVVRIDEVGFDPSENNPRITCNLWGGWPIEPREGQCDRLLELLEYLCATEGNAQGINEWILKWLAYPLQHPGAKMRTALVVHGPQRVGKNFFFESVMEIYGQYGEVIDQDALEDKYNDCFSKKLFLIADEVIARQELYHVKNKLKGMITGRRIRINPKNVKSYWEDNHCNIVFLSNETQPLVLERDDGRHAVLWTPPRLSMEFYKQVEDEVAAGGIAALYWHLLNKVDLAGFDEFASPPMTKAKEDLLELSMDSTERFGREWKGGHIDPVPVLPAKAIQIYGFYREWCGRMGYSRYAPEPKFLAEITKRIGAVKRRAHYLNGKGQRQASFIFPSGVDPPDEKSQQIWLGECVQEMENAINEWKESGL